jgi:hypothetical protein
MGENPMTTTGITPLSGLYGNKFAQTLNAMCSPQNIRATAQAFLRLEQSRGPYEFGAFAKHMISNRGDWGSDAAYDDWTKNAGDVPETLRRRLTDTIRANLRSANPLPMVLLVGNNVDPSHDLQIKTFAHGGDIYIGILMLCPNPDLMPAKAP